MLAFKLVADALGVPLPKGKTLWDQAQARLKRQNVQLPPTTRVKPAGARQPTPALAADDAARALALVLKEPLEFFGQEQKLQWLRAQVQAAGGDPDTVDAEVKVLLAAKARREADAQSLVLPGLQAGDSGVPLRTIREGGESGEVLGSILDYTRWLGLSDPCAEWCHWLRAEFRQHEVGHVGGIHEKPAYAEKQLPTQSLPTPFANFAGYRLLTKLCLRKSKIAQGMYDRALVVLGQVQVGDQRLHETLDANAASSSVEARAFVLGSAEAKVQKPAKTAPLDLEAFERQCLEDDDLDPEVAARRLAKAALARQYRESSGQQLALVKRQRAADIEKYEAESRAAKEASVEKIQAERDQTQVERARIQAERQQVEDDAKAAREERDRQRVHAAELAGEKRRAEIRRAAAEARSDDWQLARPLKTTLEGIHDGKLVSLATPSTNFVGCTHFWLNGIGRYARSGKVMTPCGACQACKKLPGFTKAGCFRVKALGMLLPPSAYEPREDVDSETALRDLKLLARSKHDVKVRSCDLGAPVWSLNDIYQLLTGVEHPQARVPDFRRCVPGRPAKLEILPGSPQATHVGDAVDVVLMSFFATHGRRKSASERFVVSHLLLSHLGIPSEILREYSGRDGRFGGAEAWLYVPGQADLEPAGYAESPDDAAEADEDASEADYVFDDDEDGAWNAVMELSAFSAKDGSPDLYCALCPSGVLKVGYTNRDDTFIRLGEVSRVYRRPHHLRIVWRKAGHLEKDVLSELADKQADVRAKCGKLSREHFSCSPDHVVNVVNRVDFAVASREGRKRTRNDAEDELHMAQLEARTLEARNDLVAWRGMVQALVATPHPPSPFAEEMVRSFQPQSL